MSGALERLRLVGVRFANDPDAEDVRTECTRLAGVLLGQGHKVIGLLPAGEHVAVPGIAIQLGRTLVALTGSPVAIVDGAGTWPGLEAGGEAGASMLATVWLEDNLAVLCPRTFDIGGMLLKIGAALADEAAVFVALLVDMTGFEQMGEHLAAMAMVDGVILVARAGRTTEGELTRWRREIPQERALGVLLTGAP